MFKMDILKLNIIDKKFLRIVNNEMYKLDSNNFFNMNFYLDSILYNLLNQIDISFEEIVF